MPADQLVRYIARQTAPHEPGDARLDVGTSIEAIERFLRHNLSDGYHALLVIEEAHLLEMWILDVKATGGYPNE
jgi:type II secretory pathway predicted ATPase ExeA